MTTENEARQANSYAEYWLRVAAAYTLGGVCTLIAAALVTAGVRWGILHSIDYWTNLFGHVPPAEGSLAHGYWMLAATLVGFVCASAAMFPIGFFLFDFYTGLLVRELAPNEER